MTDFKRLCKQLADDLSLWVECEVPPTTLQKEQLESYRLLRDAYKALVEEAKHG